MNYIRNSHGQVIGMYEQQGSKTIMRKSNGQLVGSYDSKDNTTRRANGQHYAYGNCLSQLML